MNDFDKAARHVAKDDPAGFFRWFLRDKNQVFGFHEWLDARRLALPEEQDQTNDLVARLDHRDFPDLPCAMIVELQSEPDTNMLDRLFKYLARLRDERPLAPESSRPYQIAAAVVNLTGPMQRSQLRITIPGLRGCEVTLRVLTRTLRQESARRMLTTIGAGRLTVALLPWIPLMNGGCESGIIKKWKIVAAREADEQKRSRRAAFALLFADLAGCEPQWEAGLEDWNVRKSAFLEEIRAEGRREALLELLEDRFGLLPEELRHRIATMTDNDRLRAAFTQSLHIQSLDELQL